MVTLGLSVAAVSLTDLQSDEQSQRTTKIFGSYSAEALSLPDQLVCVLGQLWKSEFAGQGNVHVKVNEKKCFGTGEGDEEITAIVNLSIDPATGNTIGKVWYDDQNSVAFNNNDGIVYIKGVVSAPPSASEPYGRFDISVVEQLNNPINGVRPDAVDGDRLSIMRIIATGSIFKFAAESKSVISNRNQSPAYSNIETFSSFADRQAKRAAYKDGDNISTVISYDSSDICFKTGSSSTNCYLINSTAAPIVGAYGLYDASGTRILTPITGSLLIGGAPYIMPAGFGGPIFAPSSTNATTGPGLVTSSTPATLNDSPVKATWLARSIANTTTVSSSLPMDADTTMLLDPSMAAGVLVDIRSEIGPLPRAALSSPVRARAGKIL